LSKVQLCRLCFCTKEFSVREIKRSPRRPFARVCLKFIFLNRAFFTLPPRPFVSRRRFERQHLNANRRSVAPSVTQLNSTLCSYGRPHSHFRPFRHFSRNFNVQREFSHRPLLVRFAHARAHARARARACTRCA